MNNKKLFGFTLAEVLITLAIIGVVAALTLPTLLSNYQKREWATKLIKTHAELQQAIKIMMANENTSQLSQTKAWSHIPTDGCVYIINGSRSSNCDEFYDELAKNLGTVFEKSMKLNSFDDAYPTYYIDSTFHIHAKPILVLKNGTWFFKVNIFPYPTESQPNVAHFYLDINGKNKPNMMGRDIFVLAVYDDGSIRPVYFNKWQNDDDIWASCNPKSGKGQGCAARILEEGKMDY